MATSPPLEYASPGCVLPTSWSACELLSVTPYNHDTSAFDFSLPACAPDGSAPLGLPTCACLLLLAPGAEHGGGDAVRPYTPVSEPWLRGRFRLLVKRYAEWGTPWLPGEGKPRTDHSYKPAGAVSNWIHSLEVGKPALFRHIGKNRKVQYPFVGVRRVTMVAVGAGIAPMVQAMHSLFAEGNGDETEVVLLYGNRSVRDVLCREQLEGWARANPTRLKLVHCIGSRWANVHMGVKTRNYTPPPLPDGFEELRAAGPGLVELGWADEAKIRKHGFPPAPDARVFVCGLPGVYEHLCGPRDVEDVAEGTALHRLGYSTEHVIKF